MTLVILIGAGFFVTVLVFWIGVHVGQTRTQKALQEAFDAGIEEGKKAITQNSYRQEGLQVRLSSPLQQFSESLARMVASYGIGLHELSKRLESKNYGPHDD